MLRGLQRPLRHQVLLKGPSLDPISPAAAAIFAFLCWAVGLVLWFPAPLQRRQGVIGLVVFMA